MTRGVFVERSKPHECRYHTPGDTGEGALYAKPVPIMPCFMIQMQLAMQKWSMTTQLQSTLTQSIGDTLKGIIQKMG